MEYYGVPHPAAGYCRLTAVNTVTPSVKNLEPEQGAVAYRVGCQIIILSIPVWCEGIRHSIARMAGNNNADKIITFTALIAYAMKRITKYAFGKVTPDRVGDIGVTQEIGGRP